MLKRCRDLPYLSGASAIPIVSKIIGKTSFTIDHLAIISIDTYFWPVPDQGALNSSRAKLSGSSLQGRGGRRDQYAQKTTFFEHQHSGTRLINCSLAVKTRVHDKILFPMNNSTKSIWALQRSTLSCSDNTWEQRNRSKVRFIPSPTCSSSAYNTKARTEDLWRDGWGRPDLTTTCVT